MGVRVKAKSKNDFYEARVHLNLMAVRNSLLKILSTEEK